MKKANGYDYGECRVCGNHFESKKINQDFWIKKRLVVVENVPAGVCPQCGEKVVKADVGKRLARILADAKSIAKAPTISVPSVVYSNRKAA